MMKSHFSFHDLAIVVIALFTAIYGCSPGGGTAQELYQKGLRLQQDGDLARAETLLLKSIQMAPGSAAVVALGNLYQQQGKVTEARAAYTRSLELDPALSHPQLRLAYYDILDKQPASARNHIQAVLDKDPGNPDALRLQASLFSVQRDWAAAEKAFSTLIVVHPGDVPAYMGMARVQIYQNKADAASHTLSRVIAEVPRAIEPRLSLIRLRFLLNDYAGAEKAARDALEHHPRMPLLHIILGGIYAAQTQWGEADESYQEAISIDDGNFWSYLAASRYYNGTGRSRQALEILLTAKRRLPQDVRVIDALARLHLHHGDVQAAEAAIAAALEQSPGYVPALIMKAEIDLGLKRWEAALAAVNRLLRFQPDYFHAHYLKGMAFLGGGQTDFAEKEFQLTIHLEPNFQPPYRELANIALARKQIDGAIFQYQKLVDRDPDQVSAHMMLGTLYSIQKDYERSEHHFRRALRIRPGLVGAANNLAYLLAQKGEHLDEALRLALAASERQPEDANVKDTLGWVYYRKGMLDSAIAQFRASLELNPDPAIVHYHLGLALMDRGNAEKGRIAIARALEIDPHFSAAEDARRALAR
ncbi:MAG: tetratricopeptide repeat protein [Pseudomonadota bacterium]